jgi:hypothetical protein
MDRKPSIISVNNAFVHDQLTAFTHLASTKFDRGRRSTPTLSKTEME